VTGGEGGNRKKGREEEKAREERDSWRNEEGEGWKKMRDDEIFHLQPAQTRTTYHIYITPLNRARIF
jgi:hypothetical protein